LERAYERNVDGVTGQSIARNRETRHKFGLKNLKADSNGAWEDNVRCNSISEAQGQNPRQPVVRSFENYKYDQPDAEDA
jgi:hypothetical protein